MKEKPQERWLKRFTCLKTIGQILNKATSDDEIEKGQRLESKSEYDKSFKMFKDGRPPKDVAI